MHYEEVLTQLRLTGLTVSPGGDRALVSATSVARDGHRLRTEFVEVDLEQGVQVRVIAVEGLAVAHAAYLSDGRIVAAGHSATDTERSGLWILGPGGPTQALAWSVAIRALRTASDVPAFVFVSDVYPGTGSISADAEFDRQRKARGITSSLHDEYPVRFWDHYVGPRLPHLFRGDVGRNGRCSDAPVDLTPDVGPRFEAMSADIASDAGRVIAAIRRRGFATRYSDLFSIAADTEPVRLTQDDAWYTSPRISPDAQSAVALRREVGDPTHPSSQSAWLVDFASGVGRVFDAHLGNWPSEIAWTPDSRALVFVAPSDGVDAIFVSTLDGVAERVMAGGSFSDIDVTTDGSIIGLRSTFRHPPEIVRLAMREGTTQSVWPALPEPVASTETITRESAVGPDGVAVPYWLLIPASASAQQPAPLVVLCNAYVPSAWTNRWYFRWNPTAYTDAGYAVVMPDVSPSLGNGRPYLERGWGRWADVSASDLLIAVEHAAAGRAIDESRTALLGGGWGGWLAAWAAAHSARFRAVVTQGAAWNLESYQATTDEHDRWEEQLGDRHTDIDRYRAQSPSTSAAQLQAPTLIVTGDRDFRAPLDDALAMFRDLTAMGTDAQLLVMHGEGHRIGSLASERTWYQAIFAFFDHHVRDQPWARPPLL